MTDEVLYNTTEVATLLKLHVGTVRRMAARGELPSFKIGGNLRFAQTDITTWLESKRRTPTPPDTPPAPPRRRRRPK